MLAAVEHLLAALAVAAGLIGLVLGADRFVTGAKDLALRLGMSPLMVGMIVVGIGTSAPEMIVSAMAALDGDGGIAVGNALGSNVSNIGLVLGLTAVVAPIPLDPKTVRREFPFLLLVTVVFMGIFVGDRLDRWGGVALLVGFAVVMVRAIRGSRSGEGDAATSDVELETPRSSMPVALGWLVLGLVVMVAGSRGVVWGSVEIARAIGLSELVIGLTIIAIGTSLPELAASVAAALRDEHELALGNVLGSNAFNLVLVLPFPALLDPGPVDPMVLRRDYPAMILMTLLLAVLAAAGVKRGRLGRGAGLVLGAAFVGYLAVLIVEAQVPSGP